ncbi:hypothetical protein FVE85_4543 [Porphyridium purpureum]|uniref:Uncharacterized protein n=1 Tax=Porphyridium purpureum TaxID=35688 RepID=A0A5J4YI41_PORPP|nr:hypothetical protein FVE85_4543 [Porphyridium purpureum]|eukprot:POR5452..scf297_16
MQRCGSARQYSRVSSRTDVVQSSAARPMQKCSSSINLSVPENDDEVIMRNPAQPLSNSRLEISSTLSDLKPVDDGLLMSPVSPTGGAKKPVSIVKKKSRAAVDSDSLRRTLMSPRR